MKDKLIAWAKAQALANLWRTVAIVEAVILVAIMIGAGR